MYLVSNGVIMAIPNQEPVQSVHISFSAFLYLNAECSPKYVVAKATYTKSSILRAREIWTPKMYVDNIAIEYEPKTLLHVLIVPKTGTGKREEDPN